VSIHRVVQCHVRDSNSASSQQQWAFMVVHGLSDYLSSKADRWAELRAHSSQVHVCAAHIKEFDIDSDQAQQLLEDFCWQLKHDGSYVVAREYSKTLLRLAAATTDPTKVRLARACNLAGAISDVLGDYRDAQTMLERALDIVGGA